MCFLRLGRSSADQSDSIPTLGVYDNDHAAREPTEHPVSILLGRVILVIIDDPRLFESPLHVDEVESVPPQVLASFFVVPFESAPRQVTASGP
jgi:hypothetical protein